MPKTLLSHARIAPFSDDFADDLLDDAGLLIDGEDIAWLGAMVDCPDCDDAEVIDCEGRLLTPGLIDCHTHLVYGGDRVDEFEARLEGVSYAEIAKHGGGIRSTVKATREASETELLKQCLPRLNQLLSEGVTTLEIKSGYGLDTKNEVKMLRVAARIERDHQVKVMKTFLGAHALPEEYSDRADEYISLVCEQMLQQAQAEGLVDAVDVFIESIAFNLPQAQCVFETAKSLGLPIKAHVEQLSDMGGAMLAAEFNALSVDHIEYLQPEAVASLADKSTVAVLLPGAFYILRETQLPPVAALREHGIPMAIATDANPGSSPLYSILFTMNMACTLFGLTPTEALRGVTINAAKALGLDDRIGSLQSGKQADVAIWDVDKPALLSCPDRTESLCGGDAGRCMAQAAKGGVMQAMLNCFEDIDKSAPQPIYQQIKSIFEQKIGSGEWSPGQKLPSENELVLALDVSRMTINRALRELTQQGLVNRVHGRGSFVAERPQHASLIELQDIAVEVEKAGKRYRSDVISLVQGPADVDLAELMQVDVGSELFFLRAVHFQDDQPIQLESRYVNPALVPEFMQQDFQKSTSTAYLLQLFRPDEMEHIVKAVIADQTTRDLLRIGREQPCLELSRRTWFNQQVVTQVTLTYPGNRYDLGARYATNDYHQRA